MLDTNKLRGKIVAKGYTQESLAREMKISPNSISAKINGKSDFTLGELDSLFQLLDVNDSDEIRDIFFAQLSHQRDNDIKGG